MYERPYSWTPLCPSDPIPGSPDVLDRNAALFRTSAANAGNAITNLARLDCRDENYSEAILKIMEKADSVAASLTKVKVRYEAMDKALSLYAPKLREAQATSLTALNNATEAAKRKNEAWGRIWEAKPRTLSPDAAVRDQAVYDYNRAVSDFGHAKAEVASAKALLAQAIGVRNEAGDTAAAVVRDAVKESSSLNDGFWDQVGQALSTIGKAIVTSAKWVWDNIDAICMVLDAVSLILAFTGVGAPFAGAIQLVKNVARVAQWVSKAKKVIEVGVGVLHGVRTGDWGPAITDGARLAVSVALPAALGKYTKGFGLAVVKGDIVTKAAAKAYYAPRLFDQAAKAADVSATLLSYEFSTKALETAATAASGMAVQGLDGLATGAFQLPGTKFPDRNSFRYQVCAV